MGNLRTILYDAGAEDYLTQPFSAEELSARPRMFMAALRKKRESGENSPHFIQTHVGVGSRIIKLEQDKTEG